MKRIVPWQILMVLVTIGAYVIVLASGESEQAALAAAVAVAAFAALAAAFAAAVAVATFAAFAAAFAAAVAVFAALAALAALAAVAVAAVAAAAAAVVAAAAVAKEFGIPKRWTITSVGIEAVAIYVALVSGSVGLAVAIGAVGALALLAMWKFGPVAVPVTATLAPAPDGD